MKYRSTNKKIKNISFKDAIFQGLAADGGLFMPERFFGLSLEFIGSLSKKEFWEIALEISRKFISEIPRKDLKKIIKDSFNFEIPLIKLENNLYVLELFHGPTLAFKDFGARFMARVMGYFLKKNKKKIKIIVATSGDTGSAVGSGFYGAPNIKVYILYPRGKVSLLQEKQLTTFGGNIIAVEVGGNFDDCQRMAKAVLSNKKINGNNEFSSANSINFGRLLPQMFYYFWGYAQLIKPNVISQMLNVVFCVPSGNFGNLTAGLMAKRLGLPATEFIAATNANDVVPQYLKTGKFVSRISRKTISNAMDVGNPSNFTRMLDLYGNSRQKMKKDITGLCITDKETKKTIKSIYDKTGYILDPHTAVAVAAAKKSGIKNPIIALATAHPIKFRDIVEPIIKKKIIIPEEIKKAMAKRKKFIAIGNDIKELERILVGARGGSRTRMSFDERS